MVHFLIDYCKMQMKVSVLSSAGLDQCLELDYDCIILQNIPIHYFSTLPLRHQHTLFLIIFRKRYLHSFIILPRNVFATLAICGHCGSFVHAPLSTGPSLSFRF